MIVIGSSGHGRDIAATVLPRPRVFGHHTQWDGTRPYIIGINDPQLRAKVAAELGAPGERWVHPNAYIGNGVNLGEDVHINYGATMVRCTIGDGSTICPGATICGDVTIGQRVLVGAGATLAVPRAGEHIYIGDDVTIGAGAVVLSDVPAGETWVGVPARMAHQ
jgi:UDP-3-O-[3-hydroxymyristoyl] glucosamine N-acyltransferase